MKTINSFILEKLKLNKNSKSAEKEYFILLPWYEDFYDWAISSSKSEMNYKKYDYVELHHEELTGYTYIFVINYIYIKEISKKLKNENSKLYEFPANLSLDEFKDKWIKGQIKLKDLIEMN